MTNGAHHRAEMFRWGLIPPYAKDARVGSRMINARAEGVETNGLFRSALRARRCLVIADSFFEWRREGGARVPFRIGLKGWAPFAFAGLWGSWTSPEGERVDSFTIVTCPSNDLIEPIHDRMPVILSEADETAWLDPSPADPGALVGLLTPYPTERMEAYRVSPAVNAVRNKGPECIEPA